MEAGLHCCLMSNERRGPSPGCQPSVPTGLCDPAVASVECLSHAGDHEGQSDIGVSAAGSATPSAYAHDRRTQSHCSGRQDRALVMC